jgi:hypothetical protein
MNVRDPLVAAAEMLRHGITYVASYPLTLNIIFIFSFLLRRSLAIPFPFSVRHTPLTDGPHLSGLRFIIARPSFSYELLRGHRAFSQKTDAVVFLLTGCHYIGMVR